MVVIKDGEVSMLLVKNKSNLEALVNMVPESVSKINIKKDSDEKEDKKEK
nr:GerW family sporulation protein [uncultured Clostridium sp.]